VMTEDELDARFQTRSKLESGGDYGLGCLVFAGDFIDETRSHCFDDVHVRELWAAHAGDIGTIVIDGNVRCSGVMSVSDRLMCLVITGDLVTGELAIFETEVLVCGNLDVRELSDRDGYLKVLGTRRVGPR
jgi:hypothetical protein